MSKEDPDPELVYRNNGRFAPGHAPYRRGGRHGTKELRAILRETCDPSQVVETLLRILRDPNTKTADRIAVVKVIIDYRDGRPSNTR